MSFNQSYIGLRKDLLKYILGQSNVVLDVGCALGTNGAFLLEKKIASKVYGIEYDEEMAIEAGKQNIRVFSGDLDDESFIQSILKETLQFDYIIFGDVLEHLYDPLKVLIILKSMLKPDGQIIISLPNISHIELFIQVYIKGSWPKNERGIFDKTHIRWFTTKDGINIVKSAGLKVVFHERKYRSRDAIGSNFDLKAKVLKLFNKNLVTFQNIFVCQHA
ncbi:MAG: class I SAM-dependent methyltransferase [Flavobacteriaceae bacterium]|nr:class I SAM-dependent methyltransferase [Flavobacteriaceae bacterium]